ncbi:sensor domain-containing diguanylate cyclase [Roseibium aquae]|uniref:Sensor domain-containing diguanylate cyclase n=1 Tax=Roseibium aquae TaxID=1323746 RepID=A0A916TKI2_9HYPH|nr:sensor domain-containing diguanylate cyclase [Roseibium aquae]
MLSNGNAFWVSAAVGFAFFLSGILITFYVSEILKETNIQRQKQDALAVIAEARAQLEGEVGKIFALGRGIRSHINVHPERELSQQKLSEAATDLIQGNPALRVIGIAPDNIIETVFPLEENRAAIGFDYRTSSEQWPSVHEAMIRRSEIMSGPYNLVQGGRALIARIPVYPSDYPGQPLAERRYWGVVSVVIDEDNLMKSAGLSERMGKYRLAIGAYAVGSDVPRFVYGDPYVLRPDAVSLPLYLPTSLGWELMSYPIDGWRTVTFDVWATRMAGGLISALFAGMALLLVLEMIRIRAMALQDSLTGLANRRLLEDRMSQLAAMSERSGRGFDIFYIDLNGFKPINDSFGHSVGDLVLIEIGQRLRQQTREMDTVARVGGDEFIVLTPGGMSGSERSHFAERLARKVSEPFLCGEAKVSVAASIGSASFPEDAATVEDLMRVADSRMYVHKEADRPVPSGLSPAASLSG